VFDGRHPFRCSSLSGPKTPVRRFSDGQLQPGDLGVELVGKEREIFSRVSSLRERRFTRPVPSHYGAGGEARIVMREGGSTPRCFFAARRRNPPLTFRLMISASFRGRTTSPEREDQAASRDLRAGGDHGARPR